jgi:hypothetical protein
MGWYPDIVNTELSRSNGLRKDRRVKDEEEDNNYEEDNDYEEDNCYDYDDDVEDNVDNENLVDVSKLAHCIKYPEALIGFLHSFHENAEILSRFWSQNSTPYFFILLVLSC